jgi:hypothetical protein
MFSLDWHNRHHTFHLPFHQCHYPLLLYSLLVLFDSFVGAGQSAIYVTTVDGFDEALEEESCIAAVYGHGTRFGLD